MQSAPQGWQTTTDGTSGVTFEVVSPVLSQNEEGFQQIRTVCDILNDTGAEVSIKCGLHVHIGASDLNASELANVANRWNYHANQIDTMVAKSRRSNNNHFCRNHSSKVEPSSSARHTAMSQSGRYYKMNLRSFLAHGTVECRQHQGTLNASKIINWVKFVAVQVEVAKHEAPSEAPAASSPVAAAFHLRGRQYNLVRELRVGDRTTEELMANLNCSKNTLQSTITRMRAKGVNIVRHEGMYRLVEGQQEVQRHTYHGGLFDHVDEGVQTYLCRRQRALGTSYSSCPTRNTFSLSS